MDVFKQLLYPQLQVLGIGFLTGQDSAPFRDRSSIIVLGQKDNRTSSKSCHGMRQDGTGRSKKITILEKKEISIFYFFLTFFLTEEFVPGFLLLPLSRDKVTMGQGNITSSRQT